MVINDKMKEGSRRILNDKMVQTAAAVLLVGIQILIMLYWMQQRSNYYIDELFSMGYAHSYTFERSEIGYINASRVWKEGEWIPNEILKSQIEVSPEDSLLQRPVLEGLQMLFMRRNYHGILNLLMSVFSPGKVGKEPGILFNILIFALTQVVLFRICRGLTGSYGISMAVLAMYGFSAAAVSFVMYIRFYCFTVFLFLLAVRMHQIMRETGDLRVFSAGAAASMLLLYLALRNSELIFVLGGSLAAAFVPDLLLCGKYKKAFLYGAIIVPASLYYLVKKTFYVAMLLHPADYTEVPGPQGWMTTHLLKWTFEQRQERFARQRHWLAELVFGNDLIAGLFLLLILGLCILRVIRCIVGKMNTFQKSVKARQNGLELKRMRESPEGKGGAGFYGILLTVNMVYFLFGWLTAFPNDRYHSFSFPMMTILLWAGVAYLIRGLKHGGKILVLCGVLTAASVITAWLHPEHIRFIYPGDRVFIRNLRDSGIQDAVVLCIEEERTTQAVYECVNLMEDSARICPLPEKGTAIDPEMCPDRFLIWTLKDGDIQESTAELKKAGYTISDFGRTHASHIYIAGRAG